MPDLFTHFVTARVPGLFVRDRRLVALLAIGTFLPDIAAKGIYWILQAGEHFPLASHSVLGVLLLSYLACLFVDEPLRRQGFALLSLGGLIHLLVDMTKDNLGAGAVYPFLPFSPTSYEFGWIDPENVVLLVPLDAALLGAILLYERSRDRVRQ
ncbi:MAG TPA: metal-dependent hydrolase [Planctomycetota bacterium]|nr:metal-dependent hydrolase [Planctomycetota bacterium]